MKDSSARSATWSRRRLLRSGAALSAAMKEARPNTRESGAGQLTDVAGVRVGHFTDRRRPTGCTAILFENGAIAGVDVRGAAPGTRDTELLDPINTVQKVNAILLSGGSAFGLETASGAMKYLEERGAGFHMGAITVPIVPAAILFDLGIGDGRIRPDAAAGYAACQAASAGPVAEGSVGAGAGATVGKLFGMKCAMKSGLGTASIHAGSTGIVVAALAAVNGVGDVRDPTTAQIIAGARNENGPGFRDAMAQIRAGYSVVPSAGANTTLGIVVTNALLTKAGATKMAQMAHDGFARTINPVHTGYDGDTIFAAATGALTIPADISALGALAADAMAMAIVRAVRTATGLPGLPSITDLTATPAR